MPLIRRTCRVGISLVPGACHVGNRGMGMLGADIIAATSTGEHGPGLMVNDGLLPDREYRLVISNSTFAPGALQMFEDGSYDFIGPGTATQTLYEGGVALQSVGLDLGFETLTSGVVPAMQAARTMAALNGSYAAPASAGVLPSMQAACVMAALSGSYAAPSNPGVLPAMHAARVMAALSGSYEASANVGLLPSMEAARVMAALSGSYATPAYAGLLAVMQLATSMPLLVGAYSGSAWTGALPVLVLQSDMPAITAGYVPPGYVGSVEAMSCLVQMPSFAGSFAPPSSLPQATPGYATQEDMRVRFGQTELVQLTDRAPTAQQVDTDVLTRALLDADAEINMRLLTRYRLPLEYVPRVLVNIACDIARWRLMEDRATDQVTRRYEDAVKLLDKIGRGDLALGLDVNESQLKTAGGPTVVGGGTRVFSRGRLSDYSGGG